MKKSFARKMGMLQVVLFTMGAVLLVAGLGVKAKIREAAARTTMESAAPAAGDSGMQAGRTEAVVLDRDENRPVEETDVVGPVTPEVPCEFGQWVGSPVNEAAVKETGRVYRILPPGSMMTMDYNAARINVETDGQGIVTRVTCG